jgi:Na+/proline symporter
MESNQKSWTKIGGVVFVGCMFLGAGIGMLFGKMEAGGAIGMGIGFIAMAYLWATNKA